MLDKVMEECSSILQALGLPDGEEDRLRIDYIFKHLVDLRKQYQAVASEAIAFLVD